MANVEVNGRRYRLPERPTVVVCFDGCDPEYIRRGFADGILPTIAGLRDRKTWDSPHEVPDSLALRARLPG